MINQHNYTDKQINQILSEMIILIDTREQENKHITNYFEKKKIAYETKIIKEKTFFCKFREKLNEDFFQNPKRAKCYQNKFCSNRQCITFNYIIQKYVNYRGI